MFVVRCYECEPPQEFILHEIFPHWEHVHGLQFDLYEATLEEVELATAPEPSMEMHLEQIEAAIAESRWTPLIPYYRWRVRRLRREIDKLRDDQLRRLLETPFP
jgi:hypothetical protein